MVGRTHTKLFRVNYDKSRLSVETKPAVGDDGLLCHVAMLPTNTPGPFDERVEFVTDDPKNTTWGTDVRGKVLAPVEIVEAELPLGQLAGGEAKRAQLRIFSPYGAKLEVMGVQCIPESAAHVIAPLPVPASELAIPLEVRTISGERLTKVEVTLSVSDGVQVHKLRANLYALAATK